LDNVTYLLLGAALLTLLAFSWEMVVFLGLLVFFLLLSLLWPFLLLGGAALLSALLWWPRRLSRSAPTDSGKEKPASTKPAGGNQ
jgi:hypothetical protein